MSDLVVPSLGFTPGEPWTGAPCGWPVQQCGPLPEIDDESYEPLRAAAAEVLWKLSGRQYGCCEETWRPCGRSCLPPAGWPNAVLWSGQWINVVCRPCAGRNQPCSCKEVCEIYIPGPICEIIEVTIDGEAIPTGSYRVDDGSWLVRQVAADDDPRPCWPTCQDMALPLGEVSTWGVRISRGVVVPPGGQRALGELMSELWKACSDDSTCKLPRRVQTIARQGVSFAVLDPMNFLTSGKTGLYFTDLWLQSVNPKARPAGARIASPDFDPGRTTTWP